MDLLEGAINLILKLFSLGLFISIILNWIDHPSVAQAKRWLNGFYDIFLDPLRRVIKPIPIRARYVEPVEIDITPGILLLLVLIVIRPFLLLVF